MKPSNPANNKPIRLALADDHHVVRKALISMFHEYAEIEVLLDAADGQELIEKLKTACVLPDICLLDNSMERMDGYETLRAIHAEWPEIKCIVLSQYNSAFHIQRMVQHGAKGYLVKDCEPEELRGAIKAVYEGYLRFPAVVASGSISKQLVDRPVHIPQISNREYDFLKLCRDGFRNAEIAKRMYVSEKTVEHYQHSLFEKMQVSSRVGLVLRASECGIL